MNQDDFKKLLDEGLKPIKETQEEHTRRLEALAGDVHNLQDQTKAIWDKE